MPRVQVGYNPGAEALQPTATPNIHTEQARNDPNASKAFQLAAALGSPTVMQGIQNLQQIGDRMYEQQKDKDAKAGQAWANGQTLSDLGRMIQDGKMLPSQSPAFVAAASHTYGENALNAFINETTSKMNRGEMKFDTPEELDAYLLEARKKILNGRNEFAIAGFDKRWMQASESIKDANNKVLDSNFRTEASQNASDAFRTIYDNAKRDKLAPDVMVSQAIIKYDQLKSTGVLLTKQDQQNALKGFAMTLAMDGNQEALNKFLDSRLPNNGPSIRAIVGDQDSLILQKNAEAAFDKTQRQEADNWLAGPRAEASDGRLNEEKFRQDAKKYESILGSATVQSIIDHNRAVQAGKAREVEKLNEKILKDREDEFGVQQALAAISAGREVQDVPVPSGRTLKAQDIGTLAMQRFIAANPNMAPQEIVRRYVQGGVKNPQLERKVTVAVGNIGEVNIDAAGKPTGQLLPATLEALDTFALVRQISEPYARDMAGSERNYETLQHIQALRENGIGDANLAAALVNQKNRRNIPPSVWGSLQKSINAEIEQITNPGITTGRFWGEVFRGEFGNGEKNLIVVKDAVRRLAETYLAAGVAGDAKQAVQKASEYFADPRVTTQINNTIYLNKDLPDLPQGMDRTKWFEKAMEGVVGEKLKAAGIKYDSDDLTLIPQDGGNKPYMVSLRGVPMGIYVGADELKSWIMKASDKEDAELVESKKPKEGYTTIGRTRVKTSFGPKITGSDKETPWPSAPAEEWKLYREDYNAWLKKYRGK